MGIGLYYLMTSTGKRSKYILLGRGLIAYGSLMDYLSGNGGILIGLCTIFNISFFIFDAKRRDAWNIAWKYCRFYFQEYDGFI